MVQPLNHSARTTASSAAPGLRTVRKARVFEEAARQIQAMIVEGVLKPGDHLPPERELAERFGVSRNSVRDAIRVLEIAGLVIPRHGDGTVVADLSASAVLAPISVLLLRKRKLVSELIEVRKMLEPALAARAAVHASAEDVARLRDIVHRQQERVVRGESTIEEDSEFHAALARAAHNSVVLKLLDTLMDLLRETRSASLQVEGRLERSLAGHRRVVEAIARCDADGAERAMRRHLEEIEGIVLQKL